MKTVMIGIARMGSTRLPGKVMMELDGIPVLKWVITAGRNAVGVDEVWIATSTLPQDDAIVKFCGKYGVPVFRGSETDVLSRFAGAARAAKADVVVRVTCDCPFLDPKVISEVVALRKATGADYASNIDPPAWPDGLDTECFTTRALYEAEAEATRASDRDTVTQFILRNRYRYKAVALPCPIPGLHKERWVLDTENDLKFCQEIALRLESDPVSYLDILAILDREPELRKINAHHPRNERFFEALASEPIVARSYGNSKLLAKQAEKFIPLGCQTFSKSKLVFPDEAPRFLTHGQGGLVYDVDGNDYVDLVGGLLPNVLGYRDPDVDEAIRRQLDNGITFSLSTELEAKLANALNFLIPSAQKVRFGKTGTDATTAAVRLARAFTGRKRIAKTHQGYHGWADWTVGNDEMRKRGVPYDTAQLTSGFLYDNRNAISTYLSTREYAAVIVEPETNPDFFLQDLKYLCATTGTLLIFDEVITGFRWHVGGAQSLFGVMPDLACFSKSMGNGMPISAIVGRDDVMKLMEPPNNIFYSGTFFGETLSLAAALACVNKVDTLDVPRTLKVKSDLLYNRIQELLSKHDLHDFMAFDDTMLRRIRFLGPDSERMAMFFREKMAQAGVLIINSHNLCHAHTKDDMLRIARAYDFTFEALKRAITNGEFANAKPMGVVA